MGGTERTLSAEAKHGIKNGIAATLNLWIAMLVLPVLFKPKGLAASLVRLSSVLRHHAGRASARSHRLRAHALDITQAARALPRIQLRAMAMARCDLPAPVPPTRTA